MSPAQLAAAILEAIRRSKQAPRPGGLYHRQDIWFEQYGDDGHENVRDTITGAWEWMLRHGITIPGDQDQSWRKLSAEGKRLLAEQAFDGTALPQQLPEFLVHTIVSKHAEQQYMVGQHDDAVLSAMRQLEILVRKKIGASAKELGTDLMRKGFNIDKGLLRDPNLPLAEREGDSNLFAGIVGAYRNAVAHRDVGIGAVECGQVLICLSMLISIVESRQVQPP
jgi:hypothetical protein